MARLYRDAHGVPHVRADDALDLAHGQGAVTALDRTWQLEWLRRRGCGTTAALVGAAGLDWDRLARRTRIVDVARRAHAGLDEETVAFVAAYVAGVNATLSRPDLAVPPELVRLGAHPQPWEEWTPLAVLVAQHLLFANLGGKLWAQRAAEALGDDAGLLDPEGPPDGSNAWGVGGGRTASGMPLIGGDPHRIIESPGVYQQVRLACEDPDDTFDVVGLAFPGVPGTPHFAHAGGVAWAITNAMADYQDVYAVVLDDRSVLERHVETIEVAGGDAVEVEVVSTSVGDVIDGGTAVGHGLTLRSAVAELGDCGFAALLPLLRARTADDVERAYAAWVEPVNNLVVADTAGALRYRVAGRVPVRAEANRHGFADAADPASHWRGWLDPLPQHAAGPDGRVVTANERRGPESDPVGSVFAPPYRAERLHALLAGRDDLTTGDFAAFHDDAWLDPRARLEDLTRDWSAWLEGWDGVMAAGSTHAATFAAWRGALVRRIVAEPVLDDLRAPSPDRVLAPFLDLTVRVGRALPALVGALGSAPEGRPLGIDLAGHARAARDEVLAFAEAGDLPATWGATHVFAPVHALGSDAPPACAVPAVPLAGDTDCVRSTASVPGLSDACSRGSVARYVWDLADRQAGGWVVPTGADADPASEHHHDQLESWAAGRLVPIVTDWDRLRLVP